MEIPAVNIDDVLVFTAVMNAAAGDTSVSDTDILNQTVVGSYDPNDKTCLEGNTISPSMVGDYLHYLIRFQNSGTAPAENVVVRDVLNTGRFDVASLQLTSTSHPCQTRLTGNRIEFIFNGINLPAEQDNEPASHGYIAFKIKTKSNLVLGNAITNKADIFFDYNFPIATNNATTTVTALGLGEIADDSIRFYPNPTKNFVQVSADSQILSIGLFDLQGRLLQTQIANSNMATIDITSKASGVYFVKTTTVKGIKTEKLIKE